MGTRKPFTKRERHGATQNGLGHRPVNDWGAGDLPAPFAEGDVLHLAERHQDDRLYDMQPGYFVVTYATSIDEGDCWYFRVWDGNSDRGSDRLHVAYPERSDWDTAVDYMAPFTLVDTADPDGLALRQQLIEDGWKFEDRWDACPTCGHVSRKHVAVEQESE